jgi:hypothetical protein
LQGKKDTKCHFFIFYKSDFFSKNLFQNGYNKVVIELRIARLISDQIALHSVQLPL